MSAEEHLANGDLDGALAALQDQVRKDPADPKLRIFLFQLLCVLGDWKRAITQLKVSGEMEPLAELMAQTYREAIICENFREKVFAGEKDPLVFGEPQEWVALLVEASKLLSAGNAAEAADLRARAFDMAPTTAGTLNGAPFDWVADADMRLGPLTEMIVNGRYFWVPFSAIHKITAEEPADLRDSVWFPVTVTLTNGGDVVALIPTRYPGSEASDNPAVRLARATEWSDAGSETFIGHGQRLLATDAGDTALMDLRSLVLGDPPEELASGDGDG